MITREAWYRECSSRQRVISEIAKDVREDFGMSPCQISRGWCGDYATVVWENLRDLHPDIAKGVQVHWDDDFRLVKNTGHDTPRGPWDQEALRALGVTSPPPGETWESVQRLTPGSHIFLVDHVDKKFYDSDAPQGVDSLFDLPLFQEELREVPWRST